MLQRLAQLIEQPRVLDGYDGLRSEVGDQLNLLVGKRPYLLAINPDHAHYIAFLEHRYNHKCPGTTIFHDWAVFRSGGIRNVNGPSGFKKEIQIMKALRSKKKVG